jgi:glutamate racemase
MREVAAALPDEAIVYFGDTARLPYGTKSERTVRRYAVENTNFLLRFEPKLIIAACNTVSSVAMPHLKETFRLPIVGVVEPGARAAIKATKTGRVGVIATEATIRSGAYQRALEANGRVKVFARATPLLAPMVEEGRDERDPAVRLVLEQYLAPLVAEGIDTLVLGCTHYPLLKAAICGVVGGGVKVVDSAQATAAEVGAMLSEGRGAEKGAAAPPYPQYRFYVSDSCQRFLEIGSRFFGRDLANVSEITPEEFFFQK